MKKFISKLMLVCLIGLSFTACSQKNSELNKLDQKVFYGFKGGDLSVNLKKNNIQFIGISRVTPYTEVDKWTEEQFEKGRTRKTYFNPKVVKENGKKYLTADNFKYKLEIVDDNNVYDVEDENEFTYYPPSK